jgi:(2R)-sulfolactate sulfo-lyase subunit beta
MELRGWRRPDGRAGNRNHVAAAIVNGIEPNWTDVVASGIAESGKPVASHSLECCRDLATICRAARDAQQLVQDASELKTRVINGRLTCAERLGHREFVLTRLYESA